MEPHTGAAAQQKRASVFKRGAKAELFDDGEEPDEKAELQGKLGGLHSVWAMERTGRDLAAAIWRPDLGLAEVVLQKGKLLAHMGFTRGSKLFLFIEEAVYLLDRANLLLFLDQPQPGSSQQRRQQQPSQRLLSLIEAYDLMLASGVGLHIYLVFCKLLRAGYIVQRHPARWLLRPGEDPAQTWAGWGRVPALETMGGEQQQKQQQGQEQQQSAATRSTLPAGGPAKRRKVHSRRQQSATWWVANAANMQQQEGEDASTDTGGGRNNSATSSSSANPWLRSMPSDFLDSVPRCTVVPDAAQRARLGFPRMAPLQAIPLSELQLLEWPAGGHLLHYDVFNSNSRFSRKAPGPAAFVVSVTPCTQLPKPHDMAAADVAAGDVPVRFSTIEKGDICCYGTTHVELRSILPN